MHNDAVCISVDEHPPVIDGVARTAHRIVWVAIKIVPVDVCVRHMGLDQTAALVDRKRGANITVPRANGDAASI